MDLTKQLGTLRQKLAKVDGVSDDLFERLDNITEAASQYAGIDPEKAREAFSTVETLQAQTTELNEQLGTLRTERDAIATERDSVVSERDSLTTDLAARDSALVNQKKELVAVRGLSQAGILGNYEDLLRPKVMDALEVGEDGTITAPDDLFTNLKEEYGAMFHATDAVGSGGQAASDPAPTPDDGVTTVTPNQNGVISGVNPKDVLKGNTKIVAAELAE